MKLELRDVSYRYVKDGQKILEHFSLTVDSHERVGIKAPSGYGKTTLCKLLSGYLKPDAGEILLDGKPLSSYKGYCPVQMIWQQPEFAVNPRLRMKEVILEGDQVEQRVIEGLGIEEDWMNRFPAELSGGNFNVSALQGLWAGEPVFFWRTRSVPCWISLLRASCGILSWRKSRDGRSG